MTWELLGYAGAVLMGLVLGLLGGGGSILTVPILVYLFGQDPVTATGLSLFIVGTTSLGGIFSHHRQGNIAWGPAVFFGAASVISVFITRRWLVPALPDPLLQFGGLALSKGTAILWLFALVMLLAARSMIRTRPLPAHQLGQVYRPLALVATGAGAGLLTGILGVGGGFMMVPILVLLAGMDMRRAVGTSLMLITVNSFIGFLGDPDVHLAQHYGLLLPFILLAIVGIVAGSRLSRRIDQARLRPLFGWFLLAMGLFILVREFIA